METIKKLIQNYFKNSHIEADPDRKDLFYIDGKSVIQVVPKQYVYSTDKFEVFDLNDMYCFKYW